MEYHNVFLPHSIASERQHDRSPHASASVLFVAVWVVVFTLAQIRRFSHRACHHIPRNATTTNYYLQPNHVTTTINLNFKLDHLYPTFLRNVYNTKIPNLYAYHAQDAYSQRDNHAHNYHINKTAYPQNPHYHHIPNKQ